MTFHTWACGFPLCRRIFLESEVKILLNFSVSVLWHKLDWKMFLIFSNHTLNMQTTKRHFSLLIIYSQFKFLKDLQTFFIKFMLFYANTLSFFHISLHQPHLRIILKPFYLPVEKWKRANTEKYITAPEQHITLFSTYENSFSLYWAPAVPQFSAISKSFVCDTHS